MHRQLVNNEIAQHWHAVDVSPGVSNDEMSRCSRRTDVSCMPLPSPVPAAVAVAGAAGAYLGSTLAPVVAAGKFNCELQLE